MNKRKLGLALAIGAGVATASAAGTAAAIAWTRADPHWISKTAFGPLTVRTIRTPEGERVRLMRIGTTVQGGTYFDDKSFELPFEYLRAMAQIMREAGVFAGKTLCLGGGAYALPKHVVAHTRTTEDQVLVTGVGAHASKALGSEAQVHVVEIDPAVTNAARTWFFLGELERRFHTQQSGALKIYHANAASFLDYCSDTYDCIVNDVFAASAPLERLNTPQGAVLIARHLTSRGIYLANVVASDTSLTKVQTAVENLQTAFAHVYVVDGSDQTLTNTSNYLVVASEHELELSNTIAW